MPIEENEDDDADKMKNEMKSEVKSEMKSEMKNDVGKSSSDISKSKDDVEKIKHLTNDFSKSREDVDKMKSEMKGEMNRSKDDVEKFNKNDVGKSKKFGFLQQSMGNLLAGRSSRFDTNNIKYYDSKNNNIIKEKEAENNRKKKNIISTPNQPEKLIDVGRVRMLLQNFILIKILVGHVLLSPWHASVCRKLTNRKNRIVYNCRVTATLVYEITRNIDALGTLPPVGCKSVIVHRTPSKIISNAMSIRILTHKRRESFTNMILPKLSNKINHESKPHILLFERIFGLQSSTQEELDDRKNSIEKPRSEVEESLLMKRPYFESLSLLHGYLLKPATLSPARSEIDSWITICSEELDEWISKLVIHVMTRRAKKIAEKKLKKS